MHQPRTAPEPRAPRARDAVVVAPLAPCFPEVRKIAVLRGGGIGDLLFAEPAIEALAAAYPEAEVTLLGTGAAALLEGRDGGPDRVVPLPVAQGVHEPRGSAPDPDASERFFSEQRAERYDLAVQLHGGGRFSNPFVAELGARFAIGTRTDDALELDRTLDYVYFQHEVLRWLEVAGLAGAAPVTLEPRVRVTREERERGRVAWLDAAGAAGSGSSAGSAGSGSSAGSERDGAASGGGSQEGHAPHVVLHPGASDARRRWPTDRFGAIAAELSRRGARVCVIGDESERDIATAVCEAAVAAGGAAPVNLAGRLPMRDLPGLLACADLCVANDSGPRHLAQAVGTRTASVFWCGNLVNAGPFGRGEHRVQLSWTTRCPVCGRDVTQVGWTAERCEHELSFVTDVTVDAVLADALALLPG
ncbi:glycosyltransferase family 9 protein [Leucobacter sp. USHLN153]|uniref:glycosyltransferase family 9 protein n=1 Tax=Leucobacter sp. USHLN153 TaxID=3081268 RepID=UPI003016476A